MNTLAPIFIHAARLVGQAPPRARLDEVERVLRANDPQANAVSLARLAWRTAGLAGEPAPLAQPGAHDCPFLARDAEAAWHIVAAQNADASWLLQRADGSSARAERLDGFDCVALPPRQEARADAPGAAALVASTLWRHKAIFFEALLATAIVNTLALVTSIYSMQVYDRVIPNRGFATLWVLSVGVCAALVLDMMLKQVRSYVVERAATRIDGELSQWFFERSLGIRLECRPPSVGTLAAQIKGFELVRGCMSATSIFMLADVPFAVFFVAVIGLVGGWMVLVPLALLPASLVTGTMFQRQIVRYSAQNQGQSNRKAGLLVESIDGAESLKANCAEWQLLTRWERLVYEAGESDYQTRQHASISQNVTVALQQIGYVGLVALGAYLVAERELTMGALIACTIINGRALSPIAQLPGLMVQYAHARVAVDGLNKLIALPNEIDERAQALTPQSLAGSLRFEHSGFSYGAGSDAALELGRIEIRAGERVGVIGAIGSGKSTLLKLASGLYRPAKGKVFLDGIDMALIAPNIVRDCVGYLPQDVRLVSGSLRDNLLLGLPDPGDDALLRAARETGLIALLSGHPRGLALPISEGGRGVSGGQRQLIGLTRMLLAQPRVLALDEPTASMDASTEGMLVAALKARSAAGATLIVATHKTALLQLVDRLLVMQAGRVAVDGPRDLVLAKLSGSQAASITSLHKDGAQAASA